MRLRARGVSGVRGMAWPQGHAAPSEGDGRTVPASQLKATGVQPQAKAATSVAGEGQQVSGAR
jgi:hypothetical protein